MELGKMFLSYLTYLQKIEIKIKTNWYKKIKMINGLSGWPEHDPRNWRVGGSESTTQTRSSSCRVVLSWWVVSEIVTPTFIPPPLLWHQLFTLYLSPTILPLWNHYSTRPSNPPTFFYLFFHYIIQKNIQTYIIQILNSLINKKNIIT